MNPGQSYIENFGIFTEVYVSDDMLLLERLEGLIGLHFREQRDPGFYAAELAFTVRGLNELTKLFRGRTVFGMLQERLVLEAKMLLCRSRLSSKLVAYELGFEDPSYFCRFFRRMTGYAPQDFRELCQSGRMMQGG